MTREEILAMCPDELNIAVAEKLFQAKVIGKKGDPNAKLLIGWYGYKAWQPMRGSWHSSDWSPSEEIAWLDCPRFSEDISAAWEVEEASLTNGHPRLCRYVRALSEITQLGIDSLVGISRMIHASPADRCKAALLAVMEVESNA